MKIIIILFFTLVIVGLSEETKLKTIDYIEGYEETRKEFSLEEKCFIKNEKGEIVGELYKGCKVYDSSLFDFSDDGDISDTNRFVLLFDIKDKAKLKGEKIIDKQFYILEKNINDQD